MAGARSRGPYTLARVDDFVALAPELMRMQAAAIDEAAARLDPAAFRRAVELVAEAEGRAVVTGAGTSGIIARKLAATLTSTGTPALFLHPSDALHGGLGVVTSDDVAILISNSGETDELLALVPYLEQRKVPLIAIVGNLGSTLAQRAAAVLDARADKESCPHNLAPTSSTSVAVALGDVLAMTVMRVKDVTVEGFARNHPSGRLGRRLTLRVDDVMRAASPGVAPDAGWLDVVTAISGGGLGAVAVTVTDGGGDGARLLGIVTDGDLRRVIQRTDPARLTDLCAADFMTADPVVVTAGALAYDALQLMENRPSQISVLPVVDELGHCAGLVRLHDLVRSGI